MNKSVPKNPAELRELLRRGVPNNAAELEEMIGGFNGYETEAMRAVCEFLLTEREKGNNPSAEDAYAVFTRTLKRSYN